MIAAHFNEHLPTDVIPAKAGIQSATRVLDSGFRRNDGNALGGQP
jgi:hypothetical protein